VKQKALHRTYRYQHNAFFLVLFSCSSIKTATPLTIHIKTLLLLPLLLLLLHRLPSHFALQDVVKGLLLLLIPVAVVFPVVLMVFRLLAKLVVRPDTLFHRIYLVMAPIEVCNVHLPPEVLPSEELPLPQILLLSEESVFPIRPERKITR
jgi:hypothetical protein